MTDATINQIDNILKNIAQIKELILKKSGIKEVPIPKEPTTIEIKKIEIKIGEETIFLTFEQAKELKRVLNDIFPVPEPSPLPYFPYPVYPWESHPQYPYQGGWKTTCGTGIVTCSDTQT